MAFDRMPAPLLYANIGGSKRMSDPNIGLVVVAVIVAVLGVVCLWWRSRTTREIRLMSATPLSTAADAAKAAPGSLIKMTGTLRCAAPISGEFSHKPCAYFKAEISRQEDYYENEDGKQVRKTRTVTIHSATQSAPCTIADSTGSVALDFTGASVEAVEVINQYGNPNPDTAPKSSGFMAALERFGQGNDRYKENILAPDIAVYVMGEAHAGGVIGAPAKGSHNKVFVISHKSEAEHNKDLGSTARLALWLGIVFFVIAAAISFFAVAG
jgi:hypothetical protein